MTQKGCRPWAARVVDFHTHVFPDWLARDRLRYAERDATLAELYSDPKSRMANAEDLIASMDEDGVDVSVVMGVGWTDQALAREANDYLIESTGRYPERLVGFGGLNPAWGDGAAREAERCADAGLMGVGELHPDTQGYDLDDPTVMRPLMEVVRERRLIVVTHSSEPVGHAYKGKGDNTPGKLWRFILGNPDVPLVFAHWGGGLPFYSLMPEVRDALENVYFDTGASPFLYTPRVFPVVASLAGHERILFGSDFPLVRAERVLAEIEESELSQSAKEAVSGANAEALLWGRLSS